MGGLLASAQEPPQPSAAPQQKHNNLRKAKEVGTGTPTVEEAQAFLDDAEKRLMDLAVKQSRASWVEENFITVDTEALAADAGEKLNTLSVELAKQAARFDGVQLPPVVARKMKLLKLASGFPAPNNPAEQKELAEILASLEGDYGRGKWCPDGAQGKCLDVTAVGTLMAEN